MPRPHSHARLPLCLLLAALTCAFCGRGLVAEEAPDALVVQLSGDDFDSRQTAEDKLKALGESARPALEKALKADDPDIRQVAAKLLVNLKKATIRICAFDRDGKPAAGAEADVRHGDMQQINSGVDSNTAITLNAGGGAEVVLQPSNPVSLYVTWKNWFNAGTLPSTWPIFLSSGVNPLVYTLSRPGSVRVRVNDDAGKPLKDARVSLYTGTRLEPELIDLQLQRWGQQNIPLTANTADTGVATVENVPEGVYQIIVRAEGYGTRLLPLTRVREAAVADAGAVALSPSVPGKVQFTLKRASGASLSGKTVEYTLDPVFEGQRAAELRKTLNVMKVWNGRNRQQTPAADASGKVVIDTVAPGKYELQVRCEQGAPQRFPVFTLESGQTVDLGEKVEIAGGTIKGKATPPDGKSTAYVYVSAVPEQDVIDSLQENHLADWRYARQDSVSISRVNSQANGAYELKDIAPGRYTVVVSSQFGASTYIFGVEVESGKTVEIPDVAVGAAGQSLDIRGRVTFSDGKPAAGANVWLSFVNQNTWTATCDGDGAFKFQTPANTQGAPIRLGVRCADCKPYLIDLTHTDVKLESLTVQLEKQRFGDARVKIVDEAGAPLAGVSVGTSTLNAPRRKTNKDGEVDLTGLAIGSRLLTVDCEGYFVHEPRITVDADSVCHPTIVMKKGFELKGSVAIPAGVSRETVVVVISGPQTQVLQPDAEGQFKFQGLTPGEYLVSANAPAHIALQQARVVLKPEQQRISEVRLELVHASGIAIQIGADFEGCNATLRVGDHDKKADDGLGYERIGSANALVDAGGRVEFWGVAPGDYELLVTPPQRTYNYYGRTVKVGTLTRLLHEIRVGELKTLADLKTAPVLERKIESSSGSIVGRLALDSAPGGAASNGNFALTITGPAATSMVAFTYPHDFQGAAGKVLFTGDVPFGLKPPDQGMFIARNLPAGEYTVQADLHMYRTRTVRTGRNSYTSSMMPESEKRIPQTLTTFTLKDGESLDLGALTFAVSKEISDALSLVEEFEGQDQIPSFQP